MAHSIRTTQTTVTFKSSFRLSSVPDVQPPGTYQVITEQDELPGVSFVALRRSATMLRLPAVSSANGSYRLVTIEPAEIEVALAEDRSPPDDS